MPNKISSINVGIGNNNDVILTISANGFASLVEFQVTPVYARSLAALLMSAADSVDKMIGISK